MNVVGILVYVIWVMVGWLVGGVVFCHWSLPIFVSPVPGKVWLTNVYISN